MSTSRRTLVLVTGQPGSGKTSLARPLAAQLDLTLLSKDTIKEALACLSDSESITVNRSKALGSAAFEVLFALLREGTSAVVEASWNPEIAAQELRSLSQQLIEVHCRCDPETARGRYIERASRRHWVHTDHERFDDARLWSPSTTGPLLSGNRTIEVDTTRPVDIRSIAGQIETMMRKP